MVEEIGVDFQQRRVAGPKACKEDRVHSAVSGHAIFGPEEPTAAVVVVVVVVVVVEA